MFILFLLLGLTLLNPSPLYASQELVQNGDFETGNLKGWTHSNSYVTTSYDTMGYYDAMSHPPHKGSYSAAIGTATQPGTISQTIEIPAKSSTMFTAWYRLERSSSLTISLKAADGSVIKQWSYSNAVGAPVWNQLTYTLDVTYAGQSVTIEVDGVGFEEAITGQCYYDPTTGATYCLSSYNDYYAFIDDISMAATITEYVAQITMTGLPQGLSATVFVDNQPQSGNAESRQSRALAFPLGSSHTISVDQYVMKDNGTRFYCAHPTATVNSDQSITFDFRPQHYLTVMSPLGSVNGSGWYDEGSNASVSINQNSIPMQGLIGLLGARYVFQRWAGDASSTSTSLRVTIDGPKSISATWAADYTILYVVIAGLVALSLAATWLFIRSQRRAGKGGTEIFVEDRPWGEPGKTRLETSQKQETEIFREKDESKKRKK